MPADHFRTENIGDQGICHLIEHDQTPIHSPLFGHLRIYSEATAISGFPLAEGQLKDPLSRYQGP